MPKFNPGTNGIPLGAILTGATMYFFGEETVSNLELNNTAAGVETFTYIATSNITRNATNTANSADKYGTETLSLFSSGSITLGGSGSGACPTATPSASCSVVFYTPPNITVSNISPQTGPTGTGGLGVDGVVKNITGGDLANYTGASTFAIGATTKSLTTFAGGGGNIDTSVNTNAEFKAEIDYTYTPGSSTPEPVSMGLMGAGLLGLGFLAKRRRRKI
jgi:hypothetical protein